MGGVGGLSASEVAAWVAASCEAQGVPVKVTDVGIVRNVCVLLGGVAPGDRPALKRRWRPVRPASEPPAGFDALGVEGLGASDAREDHRMVQDG